MHEDGERWADGGVRGRATMDGDTEIKLIRGNVVRSVCLPSIWAVLRGLWSTIGWSVVWSMVRWFQSADLMSAGVCLCVFKGEARCYGEISVPEARGDL